MYLFHNNITVKAVFRYVLHAIFILRERIRGTCRVANANFMRTSRKWEPSCDDAELFVPQFNGSLIDPMKDCPLFGRQFDSAMASSPSVLLDLFQIHSTT